MERQFFNESEMALFFECTEKYAPNLLDTADIVRDAIYRQVTLVPLPLVRELKS